MIIISKEEKMKIKNLENKKDLAKFIAENRMTISCSESRRIISMGKVKVNGKIVDDTSHQLVEGDEVEVKTKRR